MVQGKGGETLAEKLWKELMEELAFAKPEAMLSEVMSSNSHLAPRQLEKVTE